MRRPVPILLLAAIAASSTTSTAFAAVFGDGFERGRISDYFPSALPDGAGLSKSGEPGKGKCLAFRKGVTGDFRFALVPVEPNTKYRLTFRAKVDGEHVMEKNFRFYFLQQKASIVLWRWQTHFYGEGRNDLKIRRQYPFLSLVSEKWKTYTDVFYTPPAARYVQVMLTNKHHDGGARFDDFRLEPCTDEGSINCNPDFRYGELNYAGWATVLVHDRAELLPQEDGSQIYDSGYGSRSENFPLTAGETYRVFVRGKPYDGYRWVRVFMYDDSRKRTGEVSMRGSPEGASKDFVAPAGTVMAAFTSHNHLLKEVRITRVEGPQ